MTNAEREKRLAGLRHWIKRAVEHDPDFVRSGVVRGGHMGDVAFLLSELEAEREACAAYVARHESDDGTNLCEFIAEGIRRGEHIAATSQPGTDPAPAPAPG